MGVAEAVALSGVELTRLFFALLALLGTAHLFGYLFHRLHLPRVIGEILGGVLLGPSILGALFPKAHDWMFNAFPEEGKLLSLAYWLGLILLMFISGFTVEKAIERRDRKLIAALLVGATAIPFLAGWFAPAVYDFTPYLGTAQNLLALQIVIAIAVAVTSIPVISRIFLDLGIMRTRFATVVLTTATIQDIFLWVALAVATGLVGAQSSSLQAVLLTVFVTLAFFAVALLLMPNVMRWSATTRHNPLVRASPAGYMFIVLFLFAAVASVLNVNIVFGAFLAGIVIGLLPQEMFAKEKEHITQISMALFIPIYFAIVGLKLDLLHHFDLWFFLGFLLFTTACEAVGAFAGAYAAGERWRSSVNLAVAMNARGGPGIVLATVAFDLGIINQTFFVTLVLIAIVTSLLAGWWFRHSLRRGWPLLEERAPDDL